MRKIFTLIMAMAMIVNTTNAAFTESKVETKTQRSSFSTEEKRQAAQLFVKMSREDYEKLTGKHLSLAERLSFKISQGQVKRALKREAETEGFNAGGFFLGLLLGLIGVLIAYLAFTDDNLRKWSLIGLGVGVVLFLILFLAVLSSVN